MKMTAKIMGAVALGLVVAACDTNNRNTRTGATSGTTMGSQGGGMQGGSMQGGVPRQPGTAANNPVNDPVQGGTSNPGIGRNNNQSTTGGGAN